MPLESISVRVQDLARRVHDVEIELRTNRPAVLASELGAIAKDVVELKDEVRGLRKAVIGFAITVAASAVGFAITVVLVWGGS